MTSGLLKVTREELFELVWSKPVIELAKDFGMSDVALAKRCRTLRVPIPGRGYWARVAAGQAPRRPRLPDKTDLTYRQTQALIFPTPPPESAEPAMAVPPIPVHPPGSATAAPPTNRVTTPTNPSATARALRRSPSTLSSRTFHF